MADTPPESMRIGELARAVGCPVETIRFYEREGLLPRPARTETNYRRYRSTDLARLRFVRRCRDLDMSLDEIRTLLSFHDAPQPNCEPVNAVIDAHLSHVRERMRTLRALEAELQSLRDHCQAGNEGAQCAILGELAEHGRPVSPANADPPRTHVGRVHEPVRSLKASGTSSNVPPE
ncbi:MAG: Cd(II)/Pb(II)-responsive transcriptional regulator [Burkholderiaceae bacterium]